MAARGLPIQIVAAFDFAKDCCDTYAYNHPGTDVRCIDIRQADFSPYKGIIDLVLGSLPCEEITCAWNIGRNSRKNRERVRSWKLLMQSVLVAVESIRPRWWCIEDVIQLRKYLPPGTPWMVLDAAYWSAQSRKRLYAGRFPAPIPPSENGMKLLSCVRPGPYILPKRITECRTVSSRQWYARDVKRVIRAESKSPCITDFGSRHSRGFVIRLADGRERILQFTEACTLQGFPADYIFVASQTRAWKMVAQAIPIQVGHAILEAICKEARA